MNPKTLAGITLTAVLLAGCSTNKHATSAETERQFFSQLVDSFPKASPGEFKTPESVARYFVQGVIDGRIQDTFRCFPLSQMFANKTFENEVRYVGNTYSARDGLPDDDYGRFLKFLAATHYVAVQKCRTALLLQSDPSRERLTEGPQQPENRDPATVNQWLEKILRELSFQNISNASISSI